MEPLAATTGSATAAAGGRVVRGRTLSQAESEDFASAQVPLQVALDMAPATAAFPRTPLPTPPKGGGRKKRFSFSATAVDSPIQEAECEEEEEEQEVAGPSGSANPQAVGPQDFDLLCVIGQGAFGKVCQPVDGCLETVGVGLTLDLSL